VRQEIEAAKLEAAEKQLNADIDKTHNQQVDTAKTLTNATSALHESARSLADSQAQVARVTAEAVKQIAQVSVEALMQTVVICLYKG